MPGRGGEGGRTFPRYLTREGERKGDVPLYLDFFSTDRKREEEGRSVHEEEGKNKIRSFADAMAGKEKKSPLA